MRLLDPEEAQAHLGDPNLYWDAPPYLLEPGDPGYLPSDFRPGPIGPPGIRVRSAQPWQPPQPCRAHSTPTPTPTTLANPYEPTMNPFNYVILPNPRSNARPFRARVKMAPQLRGEQLLAEVAAAAGVERATVEHILRTLFQVMIAHLRQSRPIGQVLGLFRALPAITGSYATNDPSAEEVKAGIHFTLATSPEIDAAMRAGLDVHKVDEQGTIKPVIDSIATNPGGQVGVYSTSRALRISGEHFRQPRAGAPWPSVTMLDDTMGNPVPLVVTQCTEMEIILAPMPAGTTGVRYLKITSAEDPAEFTISGPLTLEA